MVSILVTVNPSPVLYISLVVSDEAITDLGLADCEDLGGAVDGWRCWATAADEADAFGVGCQLDSSLAAHSVTRVEDRSTRDGSEHSDVLQRHL